MRQPIWDIYSVLEIQILRWHFSKIEKLVKLALGMLVLRNLTPSTTPRIIWSNKSLHIEYHLISVKFQVNIMINKLTASNLMSSFYSFFTGLYSFPLGGYPVLGRIYNTQYHDRYLADRIHIWCTFNHKCTKYCHALWMLKHHVWLHIGKSANSK